MFIDRMIKNQEGTLIIDRKILKSCNKYIGELFLNKIGKSAIHNITERLEMEECITKLNVGFVSM